MRFKLGPMIFLATNNDLVPGIRFCFGLQALSDILEVVHGIIGNPSLNVARIVSGESVALRAAGRGPADVLLLDQFVEAKIEEPRALPVQECDTNPWLGAQQRGEGF